MKFFFIYIHYHLDDHKKELRFDLGKGECLGMFRITTLDPKYLDPTLSWFERMFVPAHGSFLFF